MGGITDLKFENHLNLKKCIFRAIEQAWTNICPTGQYFLNFKIGLSLFGCAEKYTLQSTHCALARTPLMGLGRGNWWDATSDLCVSCQSFPRQTSEHPICFHVHPVIQRRRGKELSQSSAEQTEVSTKMLRSVLPLLIYVSSAFSSDLINSLLRPTKVAMITLICSQK